MVSSFISTLNEKKMKRYGLDSAESWGIAAASIVINFLILAPARLSGVLFVAFMERYGVNRKQASLPFTVCYVLRTLPGPLAGYLGERFGLREMSILGCVLSTVGVAACYFAEDITTITVLLGGCYGIGYGFVCSLTPEFLNQYFDKHLAQANGLTMGGAGLGAFLIPPIVELLINVYGVSGMLLLFGAMVMHSIPSTMLLRVANFTKEPKNSTSPEDNSIGAAKPSPSIDDSGEHSKEILNVTKIPDEASVASLGVPIDELKKTKEDLINLPISKNARKVLICSETSLKRTREAFPLPTIAEDPSQSEPRKGPSNRYTVNQRDNQQQSNKTNGAPLLITIRNLRHSLTPNDPHLRKFSFKATKDQMLEVLIEKKRAATESFRVFLDPAFFLITLTQSSYFFMMFIMWTIIVDFVRDKGIPQNEEVYFVMSLSLSDTLGRLGLGFVTDRGLMTKPNYSALCFLGMGCLSLALPWTKGFYVILTVVFTYGFISGGIMIIFPGMVTQFISKDLRTMAMASRTLLNAPMSLTISPLIGYFRGYLGTYDYIFYIVTSVSVICSLTSWSTPKMAAFRDMRKEKKEKLKQNLDAYA